MKNTLVIVLLLLAAATAGWFLYSSYDQDEDPGNLHAYLSDTYEMVQRREYSSALERYIWFHEHSLDHDPHMTGVRLSFALDAWRQLADVYPPAMEALIETRDHAAEKLRAGEGNWDVFSDVESLNQKLDNETLTVELFMHLHDTQPSLAEEVWNLARSYVIADGNHELARQYIGNPMHALARYRRSYERNRDWTKANSDKEFREIELQYAENRFVELTLELMQVFEAQGRDDLVKQIGNHALETLNDPRIEYAIDN